MMEGRDIAVDRISDLPCSLLIHILSFLTTDEAVQTCILSKRWRNVWTSLPVLKFDERTFSELARSDEEYRDCEAKFFRFVNGVLNHRQILPLDTFKFSWISWNGYNRPNYDQVFEFLRRAAECMPRVISISIYTDAFFDLPAPIFTSVSVEEIFLLVRNVDGLNDCETKSINLPSLKKLELDDMKINDSFLTMLLSGCALLEELVMNACRLDVGEISSHKLKKLALYECRVSRRMQISCTGVVSLQVICSCDSGGIVLKNISSLINADICIEYVDSACSDTSSTYLELLGGISNVTNLLLNMNCYIFWILLVEESFNCLAFNNLTSLTMEELILTDWYLVDWFLQHSPNLKKLTLSFCRPFGDEDASEEEYVRELSFQREYLEAVVIIGYEEMNAKLAGELVSTLGTLVKKIGRITII